MKWLLIVVGVLVLIVAAIAVIGAMLPQNHVATRTAQLSLSPDRVWPIVTDVSNYPAWRRGVDSVERLAAPQLKWREVLVVVGAPPGVDDARCTVAFRDAYC